MLEPAESTKDAAIAEFLFWGVFLRSHQGLAMNTYSRKC